nr:MAG TPA: hypothetical protein [Caudoviricetes sp.]
MPKSIRSFQSLLKENIISPSSTHYIACRLHV